MTEPSPDTARSTKCVFLRSFPSYIFQGLTSAQRVGSYITSWGDELQAQHSAWEQESRPAKRAAPTADDLAVRGKRSKTAEVGIDDAGLKKMFGKGDVAKVRVRSFSLCLSYAHAFLLQGQKGVWWGNPRWRNTLARLI